MCRTGGRRCPCSRGQLDRHNARRRRNRQIKAAVLEHLRQLPTDERDQELIVRLEAAPPIEAKRWAQANNLPLPDDPAAGGQPAAQAPQQQQPPPAGVVRPARRGEVVVRPGEVPVAEPPSELVDQMVALLRRLGVAVPQPETPQPGVHSASVQPHVSAIRSGQGQLPVERLLLDSQPLSSKRVGQGINDARRVDLGNGVYAYHKRFNSSMRVARRFGQSDDMQPVFEVAAWRLAERLGPPWSQMVAPCVLREVDGHLGSLSLERPGAVGARGFDDHPDACQSAGFFDRLIGQQDRHSGNYLVDERGITLIDHGFSFSRPGDITRAQFLQQYRAGSAPQLRDNERDALTRLLSSPDSLGMRGLIPEDRLEALLMRARWMLHRGTVD